MKHKNRKIAKTGVAIALATSMLANTVEGIFAEGENNVQEDTSKDLAVEDKQIIEEEKVEEAIEEVAEEAEREKEIEDFLASESMIEAEEKEVPLSEEKQTASYALSWRKFRDEYVKIITLQGGSTVSFTNQPVPAGVTTKDLTDANDRSVVSYRVGNDLIVTTNGVDQKIKFPERSDYLLANINAISTKSQVTAIDLSNVDTSDVVSFREMFSGCINLKNLDLSNFDTSKATNMYRMFFECKSLVTADITSFDTSNVTNMSGMFELCHSLTVVDVSRFNTEKVIDMENMFYRCEKLATIDTSNFKTPSLERMANMFNGCKSVVELDLGGFNTEKVTSMYSLFDQCESLVNLDISSFDTSNVYAMEYMFYRCSSLKSLDLSHFNTAKVEKMISMFAYCSSLVSLDVSSFDTSTVNNMRSMFSSCESLLSVDTSKFNTENVTNMEQMFFECKSLTSLDVSNFDTSKVQTMQRMFAYCNSLNSLDVGNFNTSKVEDMKYMFTECTSLSTLDVSNFDTSNVKDMKWMFYYCTSLPELDLSNFDTSNVESMYAMFYNCNSLTSLNVSSFNTDKVTDMSYMFGYCRSLPTLNLSNFNTENVTTTKLMFTNCTNLTKIHANEWDVNNIEDDESMFLNCTNLKGLLEDGTEIPYDANRIGKTMATPDGGYFTAPKLEDWIATVNYVNQAGQVVGTQNFRVTNLQPVITAKEIKEFIPNGYEAVNEVTSLTVNQNNEVFEVVVQEAEWTVNLEYQTVDGTVIKEESLQVSKLDPTVSAQTISDKVPTGYELVDPASDWTPTVNGEKKVIQVREVEWTLMVEFVTEDSRGVVETVTFNVSGLNPVIEAQRIIDAIPAGYYAPNEIQDLRATKDGEVFQVTVEKIESREGIVHFVDQNGITIKTEVYKVTNKDAIIRVEELEKALPVGATLVKPLTELTVTKDKEEFIIEVIMPVEEEPNQPEIGGDDTTTDAEQPGGSIEGVQTGDTTQEGLWASIMVGSIGILAHLKRKKKSI